MATKTKTRTEIIETSSGKFECEVIELDGLLPVDKKLFGTRVQSEHYSVVDNNAVIYVNGQRAGVFLKKAIQSILDIKPESESYQYWKWVSRDLYSSQRGLVTGVEFTTELGRRYSRGQVEFFKQVAKGHIKTIDEARKLLAVDKRPSSVFFYLNILEKTPYIDTEVTEPIQAKLRKKATPEAEKKELQAQLDAERLKWFDRWLLDWEQAEDKVKFAADSYKLYTSPQKYANNVYSNVLGVLDRSARVPYGRLTASTAKRYDDFVAHSHIYKEISELYRSTMPEEWAYIHNIMKDCKSPEYTLMDTKTFSTITVNWNWPTFLHVDGNNNDRGVAVLTAITNEEYDGEKFDGSLFVMPPLGLAFNLRHGDYLIADNCGLAHGQTEQFNKVDDADNIVLVFYARAAMTKLDLIKCESCRRDFMQHAKANFASKYQKTTGGKFAGVWPGQWVSEEWNEFKNELILDPETGEMKPRCPEASNTNYHYTES
jgi:hypothetical protein